MLGLQTEVLYRDAILRAAQLFSVYDQAAPPPPVCGAGAERAAGLAASGRRHCGRLCWGDRCVGGAAGKHEMPRLVVSGLLWWRRGWVSTCPRWGQLQGAAKIEAVPRLS